MVNFSLFSERGKAEFAKIVAKKRNLTEDEARVFLINEESKRSGNKAHLNAAKNRETFIAQNKLKKIDARVIKDAARPYLDNINSQTFTPEEEEDVNEFFIRERAQLQADLSEPLRHVIELQENLSLQEINLDDSVRITKLKDELGFTEKKDLISEDLKAIIDAELIELFELPPQLALSDEIPRLEEELELHKQILKDKQKSASTKIKNFLTKGKNKGNRTAQSFAKFVKNTNAGVETTRRKVKALEQEIETLKNEPLTSAQDVVRTRVAEVVQQQIKDLIFQLESDIDTVSEKEVLKEEIAFSSALIQKMLETGIKVSQQELADLQVVLRQSAFKLRDNSISGIEEATEQVRKRNSVFANEVDITTQREELLSFRVGKANTETQIEALNLLSSSLNPTEEQLEDLFVRTAKAQQNAAKRLKV